MTKALILLVEDMDPLRAICRKLLEMDGFAVLEARDGLEAISIYSQNPVDLVITDLDMPRMRGDELIRTLAPPRFLVLSADVSGIPRHWPYLCKPVSGKELLTKVCECLREQP